jgi:DNA-binding GntR family transcriptional regulator
MRRGPNTNICTTIKISRTHSVVRAPIDVEFYRNDEPLVKADVSDRSAHQDHWSVLHKLEARDTEKASTCGM